MTVAIHGTQYGKGFICIQFIRNNSKEIVGYLFDSIFPIPVGGHLIAHMLFFFIIRNRSRSRKQLHQCNRKPTKIVYIFITKYLFSFQFHFLFLFSHCHFSSSHFSYRSIYILIQLFIGSNTSGMRPHQTYILTKYCK